MKEVSGINTEIIPVIDIMGGKVVHANGGDRRLYPALTSLISSSNTPHQVIRDFLAWHPFNTVYIADLDAIENRANNHALYRSLIDAFPELTFWVDAGIEGYQNWLEFKEYANIYPVIGSETLLNSKWLLTGNIRSRSVLSLDFKNGRFLGKQDLLQQAELWTEKVIVMDLDNVGVQSGPNLVHLLALQKRAVHSQLIASGGIRNKQDLIRLAEQGIKQALVASALHDGSIKKTDL